VQPAIAAAHAIAATVVSRFRPARPVGPDSGVADRVLPAADAAEEAREGIVTAAIASLVSDAGFLTAVVFGMGGRPFESSSRE
jgi:hypothetical protein